jgi:tRNA pseudouridine55 synthase
MARKKKFDDIDGWLILDKPMEMTSTQAVARVKRLMNANKAGHAGTLDPLASGLLPIALGEATKTVPFVMDGRKVYRFFVRWGEETDTDDTEGAVTVRSDVIPTPEDIRAILPEFTGEIQQVPPKYSAIKIDGERAYDLARDGAEVELEARTVEVHRLELVAVPDADTAVFDCECGKGTYVRAMARDMGRRLGSRGHVIGLRRLLVGPFGEADMVRMDTLEKAAGEPWTPEGPRQYLKPVIEGLREVPEVRLDRNGAARLRRGQSVLVRGRDAPVDGIVHATCAGDLVALCVVEGGELHPTRVFSGDA